MMAEKKLPYEKTVVTEIKVHLADLLSRTVVLKNSVAATVSIANAFNSGDTTISLGSPLNIERVSSCLILSSMENFEVVFPGPEEVVLLCKGLFVHNGSCGRVVVRPPVNISQVRLQFVWS